MIVSSHELQFVLAKPKAKSGKVIEKELFPLKVKDGTYFKKLN